MPETLGRSVFKDTELSNEILIQLNEYRKSENNQFCDWTLKTKDGAQYPVHKVVIASACPYFKGLFNTDCSETRSDSMTFTKLSGNSLGRMLDYMYSGEIEINTENMTETFEDAFYLNLENLQNFTADHLNKNMNEENCLNFWRLAENNGCETLSKQCIDYIANNAEKFITHSFFEKLKVDEIITLLKINTLNCSEDKICEAVISWISADYPNRHQYVQKMLVDEIRFLLLSEEFMISKVFDGDLLKKSEIFSSKILEVCKIKMQLITKQCLFIKSMIPRIGCRRKSILTIKGSSCEIFSAKTLESKSSLPKPYSNSAKTPFSDNFLLVCGLQDHEKMCTYYCPIKDNWRHFPSMLEGRQNHGATFLRDKIYVCGGKEKKTVEYFDLSKECWLNGPELQTNRSSFGICSTDDCIYIVGGENKSVERLDIREGKWKLISSAPHNFSKACKYQDSLFCMGDSEGKVFDSRMSKWNDFKFPRLPASQFGGSSKFDICVHYNCIYAVRRDLGNAVQYIDRVYFYKIRSSSWLQISCSETYSSTLSDVAIVSMYT